MKTTKKPTKDLNKELNILKKRILKIEKKLQEPMATIMIKDKDGNWSEWTGAFSLKGNEKIKLLIDKVEEHFKRYFNEEHYRGKEFAIFKTINGERKLHRIIKGV